jgi:hypothetical protein
MDEQIAAIFALMRLIDTDLGVVPRRFRDKALPRLTLSFLASECGETERGAAPFEMTDQDACRIGAISPEGYRAIAAELAAMPAIDWQQVVHDDAGRLREDLEDRAAVAIRGRIQNAIAQREGSDEQVAAMHAVMRAIGAEFAWVRLVQAYERPDFRRLAIAVYHYRIDVNRLGAVRRVFRWGRIDVRLYTDESWQTIGDLRRVVVHFPHPFSPSLSGLEKNIPVTGSCPPALAEAERPRPRRAEEE